ncbi:hypothetical protein J4404_02235 [Candidatus Woesearchaeota archaeon]|nr:hypothetical protein [Candidatus Woesearchaeota archaeon]
MIIENPPTAKYPINKGYFDNGVIFDTCVLLVFFIDKYTKLHPNKKYLFKKLNIRDEQITCLNTLLMNFRISKVIITPHILSEFLNRIRSDLKEDYQDIKRECLEDLKKFEEFRIRKNNLIAHERFLEFGNDISLVLANEIQLKQFKHSCIMSFDGRFIETFFRKTKSECIAFNLDTLQYFY